MAETPQKPKELIDDVKKQAGVGEGTPELPAGGKVEVTKVTENEDEIVTGPSSLTTGGKTDVELGDTTNLEVQDPDRFDAPTIETAQNLPSVGEMDTIVGELSPEAYIDAPQGEVSSQSLAQAATTELDERATTQYQLGQLTQSLEAGKPLPAWAAPTARKVSALMAQRGLGCLLYTSPSPRDKRQSRMPSSA